jgi:hypothetical protein
VYYDGVRHARRGATGHFGAGNSLASQALSTNNSFGLVSEWQKITGPNLLAH